MTVMTDVAKPQALTERQIAWCKQNIKSFSEAWRAAQKADAQRLKAYHKLGVEPGRVSHPESV